MSTIQIGITAFFAVVLAVGLVGSKIHQGKIKSDPEYEEKMRERRLEYERRKEEEQELDNYIGKAEREEPVDMYDF